jgi:hypothetical protein
VTVSSVGVLSLAGEDLPDSDELRPKRLEGEEESHAGGGGEAGLGIVICTVDFSMGLSRGTPTESRFRLLLRSDE